MNPSSATPSITTRDVQARATPVVDPGLLMYHIDLVLLALFGVVVLFRIRRPLARLWSTSEWTTGHLLHHVPTSRRSRRKLQFNSDNGPNHHDLATEDTHWHHPVQRINEKGAQVEPCYPPHVTSCPRLLRPLLTFLHGRLVSGVSRLDILIMGIYLVVLMYPTFYQTNVFTDPLRYGWIALSQLPLVFAFATKNNVLGLLLGAGYEKLNFMHRFIGRVVVLAVNVHSLGYIYKWSLQGDFTKNIANPTFYWGLIATVCVDCLFFFSTKFWRTIAYNLFLTTHITSFILLLPAVCVHTGTKTTLPYVYACLSLYLADMLHRLIKTKLTTATLLPLPELGVTRVKIPGINAGWRAGQHVRLRVLSSGMGLLGWSEVHPFTIASVTEGEEGLVLLCKKAGDWTNKLFDLAKLGGYEGSGEGRKVKVWVEGPYGGPGHRIFASYSAAVFVAGGSGITFALSSIQELIRQDLEGRSRVKVIQLVWSIQDPSSLVPLLPLLTSMVQQSVFTPLRISVFYTSAPIGKFPFADDFFRSTALTLSPGRPKISKILEAAISKAVSLGSGVKDHEKITGMIVGVCGPVGMVDTVFEEVGKVDSVRRDQVNGVEVHEETFGW